MAVDYVKELERYIGKGVVDDVLYNSVLPSDELLAKYASEGEFPMATDPERFGEIAARATGDNLVADTVFAVDPHDKILHRTLIRHAAGLVGQHLIDLCRQKSTQH